MGDYDQVRKLAEQQFLLLEKSGAFDQLRAITDSSAFKIADSIDLSQITLVNPAIIDGANKAHLDTLNALATQLRSNELERLNKAVQAANPIADLVDSVRESQRAFFDQVAKSVTSSLIDSDVVQSFRDLTDRWLPSNLNRSPDLDVAASIALDDGIPVAWIPRAEIVAELVTCTTHEDRLAVLTDRRTEILDDCESAIATLTSEWANECRAAVAAMRQGGLDGPAQSHASNILDSIVAELFGESGRAHTKKQAKTDFNTVELTLVAEILTLRPLYKAFARWYPKDNLPPPDSFARHATSHAVGYPGLFAETSAMVAVMLAVSLTVQYQDDAPTTTRPPVDPAY